VIPVIRRAIPTDVPPLLAIRDTLRFQGPVEGGLLPGTDQQGLARLVAVAHISVLETREGLVGYSIWVQILRNHGTAPSNRALGRAFRVDATSTSRQHGAS